jgi:amino acid permease
MADTMATTDSSSWDSLYVCLMISIALIIIRLSLRLFRRQSFTRGDYWCITCAVFIVARLVANHFLLVYGSTRSTLISSEFWINDVKLTRPQP